MIFAQDHAETLPSAATFWSDLNLDKSVLICPTAGKRYPNAYGYNRNVSALPLEQINNPDSLLITADSDNPGHLITTQADIAARHAGKYLSSFLDTHVDIRSPMENLSLTPVLKQHVDFKK